MSNGSFNTFEDENRRLFDLLFRHQVYLEGVKSGFAQDYQKGLRQLYTLFAAYMGRARYTTLDGYTKTELQNFIRQFQIAQQSFYSKYTQTLITKLQQFLDVDADLTRGIYKNVTGLFPHEVDEGLSTTLTKEEYDDLPSLLQTNYLPYDKGGYILEDQQDYTDNTPTLGIAVTAGTKDSNARLWSNISNAPLPANGMLLKTLVYSWANSAMSATVDAINKGWANKSKTIDVLDTIVGNPKNAYRDGLFAKFLNQHNAVTNTVLQHVSSMEQAAIGSVFYKRYQWVSVLDNRTTQICIGRNGLVYIYGEGPLPPAHINCRSKAVSIAGTQATHDIPQDYVSWLITQPEDLLRDLLGDSLAEQITDGTINEGSFSTIASVKPLTIEEFASKLPYILGE